VIAITQIHNDLRLLYLEEEQHSSVWKRNPYGSLCCWCNNKKEILSFWENHTLSVYLFQKGYILTSFIICFKPAIVILIRITHPHPRNQESKHHHHHNTFSTSPPPSLLHQSSSSSLPPLLPLLLLSPLPTPQPPSLSSLASSFLCRLFLFLSLLLFFSLSRTCKYFFTF
jgi:hypothetical protein